MEEGGYYSSGGTGGGEGESAAATQQHYDQVFPALPAASATPPIHPAWNNKMRVGSSIITQVFVVPHEERRFDQNDSFGEMESMRTCSAIMKDTDAKIEISSSKNGSLTFLVIGKQDSVLDARRKILSTFQTQASHAITIPKAHHKVILGKAGARLRELEKSTSTKITIPPMSDSSDKISITGTRESVEKAMHQIHIISEELSKKALETISVEKEYHPFIVGAYNEKVNDLQAQTNTRIHIPPPSVQSNDITITGEKEGVEAAAACINSLYETMKKKYTYVSIEVNKQQHKYVTGLRGCNIAEILQDCGVSVEVPPQDSPIETITLRGPQEKLGGALSRVYEKANSGKTMHVDAPAWIHRYIIGKKGAQIKLITQDYPKVHVSLADKEERCSIEGPPEEVEAVYAKLKELVSSLVEQYTFCTLVVDPKHFKHIIGKNGANVNRLKEQTGVSINISDTDHNTIRIEGNKDGVLLAKQELEDKISKMEHEKEKDMVIECKYHKMLIGQNGQNIREIRDKFPQVVINFPSAELKSEIVKLRGPKEDVDKCHRYLTKKVDEIIENSYNVQIPAYPQCQRLIIGRGGANIKKLREETNTQIEMPEGRNIIIITGKEENVEKARERIMKVQNEQLNMITDEVKIPPKLYNSLIGPQGKLINSIEEDCGVKITFPPPESKSDKVVVLGLKEGVDKAKALLLEQASERELHSFTAEVRARPHHHKFLIGKSGAKIKKIRESTGTRIIFPKEDDGDQELITIIGKKEAVLQAKEELEAAIDKIDSVVETEMEVDPKHHKHFVARRCEVLHQLEEEFAGVTISFPRSGECSSRVSIKGQPGMVEPAKQKIAEIVRDLEERVTIIVDIPQRHHRAIMGTKGSKLQDIENRFDVKIKFPERNMGNTGGQDEGEEGLVNGGPRPSDMIRVTGKPNNCEMAANALRESQPITAEVDVPYEYHGGIIGNKGQTIRELMDRFDVTIEVPNLDLQQNTIKITGSPVAIELAREGLKDKIKELEEERQDRILKNYKLTLTVDPEYHPKIIGRKGNTISKIKEEFGVQITIPRKGEPNDQTITIMGYEEKAHAASQQIMAIVNQLNERAREEVEIDNRVHSRLIGSRGRNIRRIMEEFGVEIKFPRSNDPNTNPNLVVISGDEDKVADTKEKLLLLEEEFLEDVIDRERYQVKREENMPTRAPNGSGFVVKGAPWEAPDVGSTAEFPSFSGGGPGAAPASSKPTWGPRPR